MESSNVPDYSESDAQGHSGQAPADTRHSPTDEEIRLQALNHTKDKLLSILGHDLRSAIGGVSSLVGMLEKRLEAGDLVEAKRLCGLLHRSSSDADELLTDLVTWTRSQGQGIQFRLEAMDVVELVKVEVDRMMTTAQRKEVSMRIEEHHAGIIRADRYMLQAVFRNLLTNALKFSHRGGEVVVRIRRQPGLWQFEISDNGIGMSPEVQELLLKVDNRKQKVGTSGEAGSGFGLLLCEEFVQRHGGHLSWESALGKGSTFIFTIPELLG